MYRITCVQTTEKDPGGFLGYLKWVAASLLFGVFCMALFIQSLSQSAQSNFKGEILTSGNGFQPGDVLAPLFLGL